MKKIFILIFIIVVIFSPITYADTAQNNADDKYMYEVTIEALKDLEENITKYDKWWNIFENSEIGNKNTEALNNWYTTKIEPFYNDYIASGKTGKDWLPKDKEKRDDVVGNFLLYKKIEEHKIDESTKLGKEIYGAFQAAEKINNSSIKYEIMEIAKELEQEPHNSVTNKKDWNKAKQEFLAIGNKLTNDSSKEEVQKYLNKYQELLDMAKIRTLEDPDITTQYSNNRDLIEKHKLEDLQQQGLEEMDHDPNESIENPAKIFKYPSLADSNRNTTDSIDGLITDSEDFLNNGSNNKVNEKSIQDFSKTMYNILITIATFISVLIGGILGIKIMMSSAEEKAQVKELLVPYVIGCVVVFGAFGLWKLVVSILQAM